MFTGIVEELGVVDSLDDQGDAVRLTVRGPHVTVDVGLGDSVSVNGCCLTVAERAGETFTADVMRETLDKTSLGSLEPGERVNLERAVTATTRLGGHIVQGHVDGTGSVVRREASEHWEVVEIALPGALSRYLVAKGSVSVDGISPHRGLGGGEHLHCVTGPGDPGPHHPRFPAARRPREPRGRRGRQVRRTARRAPPHAR